MWNWDSCGLVNTKLVVFNNWYFHIKHFKSIFDFLCLCHGRFNFLYDSFIIFGSYFWNIDINSAHWACWCSGARLIKVNPLINAVFVEEVFLIAAKYRNFAWHNKSYLTDYALRVFCQSHTLYDRLSQFLLDSFNTLLSERVRNVHSS
jgi:hypothetical protein